MSHKTIMYSNYAQDLFFSKLCDKYGSDKSGFNTSKKPYSWPAHSYCVLYSHLFSHVRFYIKKVFECGIGTNFIDVPSNMGPFGKPGASLRVWKEYFPNANIIGGDIDNRILFQEDRIKTYYVDQTNSESIKNFWNLINDDSFDLIVDDGLHTFEAGRCLFDNSIDKLSTTGIYIIEDVEKNNLFKYKDYFENSSYKCDIFCFYRKNIESNDEMITDNNIIMVRKNEY